MRLLAPTRQKGKSSPASPLRRSEGGSRLRNLRLVRRFTSIRLVRMFPRTGPQFGPGWELLFVFHPGSNQRPLVLGINLSKVARERRPPPVTVWPTDGGR